MFVSYLFCRRVDQPHVDVLYLPNTCNNEDIPRVNKRCVYVYIYIWKKEKKERIVFYKIIISYSEYQFG